MDRITGKRISADLILITALGAVGLLLAAGYVTGSGGDRAAGRGTVQIRVDGRVVRQYPLDGSVDEVIPGVNGGRNRLHIEGGQVWVDEASCPDQVCVHTGKINSEGQAIICLPNRVVVEILAER